ncbi:MAG: response regulator, partial [Deltaproteobacteria bacterium]|nr:response regulator [Deltaproteobacteria bacterium]
VSKPSTVMVVDDEPMVRRVAVRVLTRAGYTVVEANSGEEALKRFEQEPVSCLVMDLSMPGLDGVETLAALRQRAPRVSAILVSGYASEEVRSRLGDMEASVLHKPFRADELRDAVVLLIGAAQG